ncbi:MAG: ammonium transporter, partial [Planctomycetota bacterium]
MKCVFNKINKVKISMWLLLITLGIFALNLGVVHAGDPNGLATYSDSIVGLKYAVNFTWTLLGA